MCSTVRLSLSHWDIGGGVHFYGVLRCKEKREDVTRILDEEAANRLNRYDIGATYKAGYESTRFLSKQAVIDRALDTYKKRFPGAIALIRGGAAFTCAGIAPIYDAPDEQMQLLNLLYEVHESCAEAKMWDCCQKLVKIWYRIEQRLEGLGSV